MSGGRSLLASDCKQATDFSKSIGLTNLGEVKPVFLDHREPKRRWPSWKSRSNRKDFKNSCHQAWHLCENWSLLSFVCSTEETIYWIKNFKQLKPGSTGFWTVYDRTFVNLIRFIKQKRNKMHSRSIWSLAICIWSFKEYRRAKELSLKSNLALSLIKFLKKCFFLTESKEQH